LYDEVTEDQYKSIVRGRLQKDDFVVDDGVTGYMDNGMDDFGEGDENAESDEDMADKKKKCACVDICPMRLCSSFRVQPRRSKIRQK
jgi:hypothetical protein